MEIEEAGMKPAKLVLIITMVLSLTFVSPYSRLCEGRRSQASR
jgi:hypothetical protein